MRPQDLSIADFDYHLPEEKIAVFPLPERDQSKLLIYKNGAIEEDVYRNIAAHLPEKCFLVFNNTKVINARILFAKPTGGVIEIFLLEPHETVNDYALVLQQKNSVKWKCMIGGAGKWKQKYLEKNFIINNDAIQLKAGLIEKLPDAYIVELSWPGHYSFAEILEHSGKTPLPPYIKRDAEESDAERYQTIYSKFEGSVAAPTAGLHFTKKIFSALAEKKIEIGFVTLHVGAGTFKPVKSATMQDHDMHAEWIDVPKEFLEQLINNINKHVICVGTTSVRTIESLYWMGVKIIHNKNASVQDLEIQQWEVYEEGMANVSITAKQSLQCLLQFLEDKQLNKLFLRTQIIIAPGYEFKIIDGIITNFHQPKSTLLLLVAAIAGNDWRKMYDYALQHHFRFLSYGDGCLIFRRDH